MLKKETCKKVLPDKLRGKEWRPHGKLVTEDTLARILWNLYTGKEPHRGVGMRSGRKWDRAAQLLRKNNLIRYTNGVGRELCEHVTFKLDKLEEET